ncbi:MAG: hypothetical protein R2991_00415 [Thermoanaerobaculia bacterium]
MIVRDELGRPVVGAEVTFGTVDGGGTLVNEGGEESPSLVVETDLLGRALAPMRLGRYTSDNPIVEIEDPFDEEPSRALLHHVDAVVRTGTGPIAVDAPFTALGFPGEPVSLRRTDGATPFVEGLPGQWSDTFHVTAEDAEGNPVSNVELLFQAGPAEIDESCTNGSILPDGANVFEVGDPSCPSIPHLGDCGGPSAIVDSGIEAAQVGVLLGSSLAATYPVTVSAPEWSEVEPITTTYFATYQQNPFTGECAPVTAVDLRSPFWADEQGRNVQAANPSSEYPGRLPIEIRAWQADYDWWCNPTASPCVWEWRETDSGEWVPARGHLELSVGQGGSATPAETIGPGLYATLLTTGPEPSFNALTAHATEVQATLDLPCPVCDPTSGCLGDLPWWCPASGARPTRGRRRTSTSRGRSTACGPCDPP